MAALKKLYIGTNLKMYKTIQQTLDYLLALEELTADLARDELAIFVIPSYLALPSAAARTNRRLILLGAQNMHWADCGQYTGEVSPLMLKEIGIDIIEIGHSERRQHFAETDRDVNQKVLAALQHGFTPLICIGETAAEKDLGISAERLRQQLKIALHGVPAEQINRAWVAYEPVWAIGVHGTPAAPDYATQMHALIRELLVELYPTSGEDIPVLYGGSVNPENASDLIREPAIDGLFIGRSAWEAVAFDSLIRQTLAAWRMKPERPQPEGLPGAA